MKAIIISIILVSAPITYSSANTVSYIVKGETVKLDVALRASLAGESVVKCTPVIATANKTGTSLSFKAVKVTHGK